MRRLLDRDTVFRLLVLGERLDANAALRTGIVSCVVEGDSYEAARVLAQACSGNIRSAVTASKQLLKAIDGSNYEPAEWEKIRRELLSSPERQAAVSKEKKRRGY
jgi:enoyl-CoA hydratase/carnithine racemase